MPVLTDYQKRTDSLSESGVYARKVKAKRVISNGYQRFFIQVIVFIVLCLCVELMARMWLKDPYEPYPMCASSYLPFTTPPNFDFHHKTSEFDVTYKFDEEGFRTSPSPLVGTGLEEKILVLGDSFVLGWGLKYDSSFMGQLQCLVPQYQWLNAGYTGGYSPDSYYAYLVRNAERLHIQHCIVFVYDGNDLDDIASNRWLDVDNRGGPVRLGTWRRYIDYLGHPTRPSDGRVDLLQVPLLRDSRVVRRIYRSRVHAQIKDVTFTDVGMNEAKQRLEASVKATSKFCAERHIPLNYVILPAPTGLRNGDWSKRHAWMVDTIRRIPAPALDLADRLPEKAYFPIDGHLNEYGSQIVAKAVNEWIVSTMEPQTKGVLTHGTVVER